MASHIHGRALGKLGHQGTEGPPRLLQAPLSDVKPVGVRIGWGHRVRHADHWRSGWLAAHLLGGAGQRPAGPQAALRGPRQGGTTTLAGFTTAGSAISQGRRSIRALHCSVTPPIHRLLRGPRSVYESVAALGEARLPHYTYTAAATALICGKHREGGTVGLVDGTAHQNHAPHGVSPLRLAPVLQVPARRDLR